MSVRNSRRLPVEALQPYLFQMPDAEQLLDLHQLFGNARPVALEVGFGKGAFLVDVAPREPEVNFLGIEIDKGLALYVATRLAKRKFPNVKVAHGDAGRLLSKHLPADSLAAVHVYFPDPWWKKKHRKRRVFNEVFAQQAARVIQPGGYLHMATDVAEYFQVMLGIVAQQPAFQLEDAGREERAAEEAKPETNFEKKARKEGRPVWRARAVRR